MAATQVQQAEQHSAGFARGVNIRDAPNQLADNECRRLENILLEERGGASKRPGCLSHGTFSATGTQRILSMYTFYRGTSAPQILIHTSGGELLYTNDPTAATITWTSIVTGLSTTAPMTFETFNNKCYMANGVDDYAAWTGSARTAFPTIPKGKYLRLYKDAMWIGGIAGQPDRVYESDPGNAENFGVASWLDVAKGDGDVMTGLGTDGLFLIVFKRNRTFIVTDPVTFANRVIDFEKGCESHYSIVQFESNIYFLSRRGFCQYLGDSPSRYMSYNLDPLWDENIVNLNALNLCCAYVYGTKIGWSLPSAGNTFTDFQVEYYPRLADQNNPGPFVFHRMPVQCFAGYRSGATDRLLASHNGANKVLRCFAPGAGSDDGAIFQGLVETKAYDFGSIDRTKYLRRLRFLGRGEFLCQVKLNLESAVAGTYLINMASGQDTWSLSDVWGAGVWGPESNLQQSKKDTDLYGIEFSLIFTDALTAVGIRQVPVGSFTYSVPSGEWALFGVGMEAFVLGVRE